MRRLIRAAVDAALRRLGYVLISKRALPLGDVEAFCGNANARGFCPKQIFDVGANRGDWSRTVRRVYPDAGYTLIEPQIEMAPFLDSFCREAKSASWINAGAGAEEGERKIALWPDTVSSSFAITDEQAHAWGLEQRTVPMVTLDCVCERLGAVPEMVKLDVEGFEREVMKGAGSLIGVTEAFLLELCLFEPRTNANTFAETIAMMAEFGYYVYDFTMFAGRPYDGAVGLCEIAFVRDGGVLRSHQGW